MIDPAKLLASPPIVAEAEIAPRDVIVYALGVGAEELDFVYEERLRALPTMAVVMAYSGFIWRDPQYGADWKKILHGEQFLQLHSPLPVEGRVRGEATFDAVYDKGPGKGAIVYMTRRLYDAGGALLATVGMSTFLRGDGGCGGPSEGAPKPHPVPEDRPADRVVALPTAASQALLYRLSGDLNPLHVDPEVAQAAGFERPILHGLCTYGVAGRAVLAALCGNDPARLKRLDVRFSAPVYPGETIRTEIWDEGGGRAAFRAFAAERGALVLNNGYAEVS